jgi:predicted nuclease of predicted toxin-antitoxin system
MSSVELLRASGHDVVSISEVDPSTIDPDVISRAVREDPFILTFDRDYGDLIFRQQVTPPPGIIYLRLVPTSPEEPGGILSELLDRTDITFDGQFTVVSRRELRQRELPSS